MSQLNSLVRDKTNMIFDNQVNSKCINTETNNSNAIKSQFFDQHVKSNIDRTTTSAYPFCGRNSKTPTQSPDYNYSSNIKQEYSMLERMREQLEFRKHFLTQFQVSDERSYMAQHPQKAQAFVSLQNSRMIDLFKKLHVSEQEHLTDLGIHHLKDENSEKNEIYSSIYSIPYEQLIPPLTSGESSPAVSDDEDYDLKKKSSNLKTSNKPAKDIRLEDLLEYLIDSSLIKVEADTPKRDGLQGGWGDISEILLSNVSLNLSLSELKDILSSRINLINRQSYSKNKNLSTAECFRSCRTVYYQGKYSLLVSFWSPKQAQLIFQDCANNKSSWKQNFGESVQIFRVIQNLLDSHCKPRIIQDEETHFSSYSNEEKSSLLTPTSAGAKTATTTQQSWVPLVLRNMPLHFDKSVIIKILSKVGIQQQTILSIEEPIFLNSKIHSMVVFNNVESAIQAIKMLPTELKDIPQIKVNLHPDYDKQAWNQLKAQSSDISTSTHTTLNFCNAASCFYPKRYENSVNPTSSLKVHLNRQFLEDISLIHTQFKQKRPGYIIAMNQDEQDDDHKKLSQRSTTPVSYAHEKNNHHDNETNEPSPSFLSPSMVFPVGPQHETPQQEHQSVQQAETKIQEEIIRQESRKESKQDDKEGQRNHEISAGQTNNSVNSNSSKVLQRKLNKYKDAKKIEDDDNYEENIGQKQSQQQGQHEHEEKKVQTKKGKGVVQNKEPLEGVKKQQQQTQQQQQVQQQLEYEQTPIKKEIPKELQSNEARYGGTTTPGERMRNLGLTTKSDNNSNRSQITRFDAKERNITAQEVQLVQLEVEQEIDEEFSILLGQPEKKVKPSENDDYQEDLPRKQSRQDLKTFEKHDQVKQGQSLVKRLKTNKSRKVLDKKQIGNSRSRSRSKSVKDESEKEHKQHEEQLEITKNIQDNTSKINIIEQTINDENEYKDTSISSINILNPTRMTRSKLNISRNSLTNEINSNSSLDINQTSYEKQKGQDIKTKEKSNQRQRKQLSFENLENTNANSRSERRQRREQAQILEGFQQQRKNSDTSIKNSKIIIDNKNNITQEVNKIDNDNNVQVKQQDNTLEVEKVPIKQHQVQNNLRKIRNTKDEQTKDNEQKNFVWNDTLVTNSGRRRVILEKNNNKKISNFDDNKKKAKSNENDDIVEGKSKLEDSESESQMDEEKEFVYSRHNNDNQNVCTQKDLKNGSKNEKDAVYTIREFRAIQSDSNSNVIQLVRVQQGSEQKDQKKYLSLVNKDTKGHMTLFEKLNQSGRKSIETKQQLNQESQNNMDIEKQQSSNDIKQHRSQESSSQDIKNDNNSQDINCQKGNKQLGKIEMEQQNHQENTKDKSFSPKQHLNFDEKENNNNIVMSPKQHAEIWKHNSTESDPNQTHNQHSQSQEENNNNINNNNNNNNNNKSSVKKILAPVNLKKLIESQLHSNSVVRGEYGWVDPLPLNPSKKESNRVIVSPSKQLLSHSGESISLKKKTKDNDDNHKKLHILEIHEDDKLKNIDERHKSEGFQNPLAQLLGKGSTEDNIEEEEDQGRMVQGNKDNNIGEKQKQEEQDVVINQEVQDNELEWSIRQPQEQSQINELVSSNNNIKDKQPLNLNKELNTNDVAQQKDNFMQFEKKQQEEIEEFEQQSSDSSSSPQLRKKSLSKGKQVYYSRIRDESCLKINQQEDGQQSQGDDGNKKNHGYNKGGSDDMDNDGEIEQMSENEHRRKQSDKEYQELLEDDRKGKQEGDNQKRGYSRWVNGVKCWNNNNNQQDHQRYQQNRDSRYNKLNYHSDYPQGNYYKDNQNYRNRDYQDNNNNNNYRRRDDRNIRESYNNRDDYRQDQHRFNNYTNNRRDNFNNQHDQNRNRRRYGDNYDRGYNNNNNEERSRSRIRHSDKLGFDDENNNNSQKRSISRDENGKTSRSNSRHIRDETIDLKDVEFDY